MGVTEVNGQLRHIGRIRLTGHFLHRDHIGPQTGQDRIGRLVLATTRFANCQNVPGCNTYLLIGRYGSADQEAGQQQDATASK